MDTHPTEIFDLIFRELESKNEIEKCSKTCFKWQQIIGEFSLTKVKCPFDGCQVEVMWSEIGIHKIYCIWRPILINCPFDGCCTTKVVPFHGSCFYSNPDPTDQQKFLLLLHVFECQKGNTGTKHKYQVNTGREGSKNFIIKTWEINSHLNSVVCFTFQCMHQHCKEMKNVLDHITSCTSGENAGCPVTYCQSYRHMILHWNIPKKCGIPNCQLASYSQVSAVPIPSVKEWHASVNPDLRNYLIWKL